MENDDPTKRERPKFEENKARQQLRGRKTNVQPENFFAFINEDEEQENRRIGLRSRHNKPSYTPLAVSQSKGPKRGRKAQHPLNDKDDRISLWRVPDKSNVFTKIAPNNSGFVPLSYSAVVAGRVTRLSTRNGAPIVPFPALQIQGNIPERQNKQSIKRSDKEMGNLFNKKAEQSSAINLRPNASDREKYKEKPSLTASAVEVQIVPTTKHNKKDKGWTKVTKKKKKPKANEPIIEPVDTTIKYPEPKNKILYVEMPIKKASLVVPELRANKSRLKDKRDLRKKREKVKKQEVKVEKLSKATSSRAQAADIEPESFNEGGKSQEQDEDQQNEEFLDQDQDHGYSNRNSDDFINDQDQDEVILSKEETRKKIKKTNKIKKHVKKDSSDNAPAKPVREKTGEKNKYKRIMKFKRLLDNSDEIAVVRPPSLRESPDKDKQEQDKDKQAAQEDEKDSSEEGFELVRRRRLRSYKGKKHKGKTVEIKKRNKITAQVQEEVETAKPVKSIKSKRNKTGKEKEEVETTKPVKSTKNKRNMTDVEKEAVETTKSSKLLKNKKNKNGMEKEDVETKKPVKSSKNKRNYKGTDKVSI